MVKDPAKYRVGWKAIDQGIYSHYWRSRLLTDNAISRCGMVYPEDDLLIIPLLERCKSCIGYLTVRGDELALQS